MLQLKVARKILLVCASSEDLPIKTGVADGIVANAIPLNISPMKKAIKESERVLRYGASLMLASANSIAVCFGRFFGR